MTQKHTDDQRTRLLRAMTELVAKEGYVATSIAQVIALARVSRSTFYEHFEDKLDCFLALERFLAARALSTVERAVQERGADEATHAVLSTLVELSEKDPAGARVMLTESLAAGPLATDQRDLLITQIAQLVEDAWKAASPATPVLDIPALVLVGGVCRLLALRIMRGASGMHGLLPDLLTWVDSYTRTVGKPGWRTLDRRDGPSMPRSPHGELALSPPPAPLPAGRHNLPPSYVSANQRERILRATIATVIRKGYSAATVADIVAEGHLTRAVFYQHFRDKQEVLSETNQAAFQQVMAVSARAFFSVEHWPERVWEAIHAAADVNANNPDPAHIGFVDSNEVGPELVKRTSDTMMAYAVFLEEGFRYRPQAERLPRLCSEAITTALCELLYRETRCGRAKQFRDLIPHVSYIALAPFMGPEDADAFVSRKLRESVSPTEIKPHASRTRSKAA